MNTQLLQLYPNRITITPKRKALEFHKVQFNKTCPSWYQEKMTQAVTNFSKIKNPFIISKSSKKKIMDSINSMYILSEPRKIEMKTGKFIYNFKMSFVTLTLPSEQQHQDTVIKKTCLNQFLVELRKHYGVQNYVWKAELQKNENIHFHLILDKYIDYQALRRRWNRCINKLGYVDAYSDKMQKLTLSQYHQMRCKNGAEDFNKNALIFAKGKKCKWSNPNSVDVRSVHNKNNLAIYLSKYISKKDKNEDISEDMLQRQLSFGRSWFRSYSLSSLKYINKFDLKNMSNLITYLRSVPEKVLMITDDFFTAFYFSAETLSKSFQAFHKKYIFANAKMYNYPFP